MIEMSKTAKHYVDEIDSLRADIIAKLPGQMTYAEKYKFIKEYFEKFSTLNSAISKDYSDGLNPDFTSSEYLTVQDTIYYNNYLLICLVSAIRD